MKKLIFLLIIILFFIPLIYSQVQLTANELQTIDFTNYAGSGFTTVPEVGQLDSDTWAASGMSDGDLLFGGTQTIGDFARGLTSSSVITGGFYALNNGGDIRFMVQPGGSDWTPGTLTLRIQNATGEMLTKLNIEYQIYVNNDQERANSFNSSYSIDNINFINLTSLDYTSPEASDGNGWVLAVTRTTSITGLTVASGEYIYIRWTGNDVSGSLNRDEFAIDNILLSPQDVPLPVELTSFSAIVLDNAVKLNWRTETEVSNYGFEIERSQTSSVKSQMEWTKIGFVEGHGNSNSPKDYSFTDDVVGGKYSYRLKQIDTDGQFEYSKIIEVDLGSPTKFELSQNYPNPFNPATTIRFSLLQSGNVKLTVYNLLGEQIAEPVNGFKEGGIHTINFSASNLNSGIYIYKIEANDFVQSRKMTLIK